MAKKKASTRIVRVPFSKNHMGKEVGTLALASIR
jgi:hypothetical protein